MLNLVKSTPIWILLFSLEAPLFSEESDNLEQYFTSDVRFIREEPGEAWLITKEEEEFILSKLRSDDFSVQRKFLCEIKMFRINTPAIREVLLEFLNGQEYQHVRKISNDTYGSLSGEAGNVLARLYNISSYTQGATEEEWRLELKRQLNTHPDFEGRFKEELSNLERPEKKTFVRPASSAEAPAKKEIAEMSQNSSTEDPRHPSPLYWILGTLILGGVVVLVWNSRKGSSSS
ncbi:MAG: hypothetical protein Q7Q71_08765 [Verrucomicrobiota bacterium JB023]|nr:hypothetical protein [Verrucomicrobiota bacterium JB023]